MCNTKCIICSYNFNITYFANFFLFYLGHRKGKTRGKKPTPKPIRADVDKVMGSPSTAFKYLPTRLGSGQISVNDHVYSYHFKSQRINFWRCSTQNCPAKVITKQAEAWFLHDEHNHSN